MLTVDELLTDLISRCNQALEGTEEINFFNEALGTQASKDYIRGGRFATQVFRKYLMEIEKNGK